MTNKIKIDYETFDSSFEVSEDEDNSNYLNPQRHFR